MPDAEHDLQQIAGFIQARRVDGSAGFEDVAADEALAGAARLRLLVQREPEDAEPKNLDVRGVYKPVARSAETAETREWRDKAEHAARMDALLHKRALAAEARVDALTQALQEIAEANDVGGAGLWANPATRKFARAALAAVSGGTDNSPEADSNA